MNIGPTLTEMLFNSTGGSLSAPMPTLLSHGIGLRGGSVASRNSFGSWLRAAHAASLLEPPRLLSVSKTQLASPTAAAVGFTSVANADMPLNTFTAPLSVFGILIDIRQNSEQSPPLGNTSFTAAGVAGVGDTANSVVRLAPFDVANGSDRAARVLVPPFVQFNGIPWMTIWKAQQELTVTTQPRRDLTVTWDAGGLPPANTNVTYNLLTPGFAEFDDLLIAAGGVL